MWMNMLLSSMFLSTQHPISMIIILIIFTISISNDMYLLMNNAWFSYTLLLIMIGGMMVIFIYMASTSPNTKFSFNFPLCFMMILLFLLFSCSMWNTSIQNLHINPLFEYKISYTSLTLATYLLFTLIVVNMSTTKYDSPMRTN